MDPMEAFTTNSQFYWTRLDESTRCFESETGVTGPVHIVDISAAPKQQPSTPVPLRKNECATSKILDDCLGNPANVNYTTRLISISQKDSWSRLQISKCMLRKIVEHHDVDPSFLEVPLSFFSRTTDEEQGFCVPWTLRENESSIQMFYTFRYAEYKGHPNEPWVIRQAGVYQKIDVRKKTSLYILINAVPNSAAHKRVLEAFSNHQLEMEKSPLWLHNVIHASYFMRWRNYIAEYERQLLPLADTTASTFINKPLRVSHDTLGKVRSIESRFLPLRAILTSFEEVSDGLEISGKVLVARGCMDKASQQLMKRHLENAKMYARTFNRTTLFLQERSNNTATLLADTLAFRNQGIAQEQNGSMVVLTRSAVFITVITLVYLPWTLVTGIFGMEFFEMDTATQKLMTSPQIWIYFVTAAGVTILTMALYYVMAGLPQIHWKDSDATDTTENDHVPLSLQRGYTDLEKNMQPVNTVGWMEK